MARQLDDATAEREVSKYRRRSIDGNSRLSVKEVKMTGNLIAFPGVCLLGRNPVLEWVPCGYMQIPRVHEGDEVY